METTPSSHGNSHLNSNYSHKHGGKHDEGKALIPDSHNVRAERHSLPSLLQIKTRSKSEPATSPFDFMQFLAQHVKGLFWQLKATFATSQSCRKRAIASPDPCSPMTNSAPLPTLFSVELLDEKEEPFSDRPEFSSIIMCRPIKAHAFTISTGMLGPNRNQLTEDHWLFPSTRRRKRHV